MEHVLFFWTVLQFDSSCLAICHVISNCLNSTKGRLVWWTLGAVPLLLRYVDFWGRKGNWRSDVLILTRVWVPDMWYFHNEAGYILFWMDWGGSLEIPSKLHDEVYSVSWHPFQYMSAGICPLPKYKVAPLTSNRSIFDIHISILILPLPFPFRRRPAQ